MTDEILNDASFCLLVTSGGTGRHKVLYLSVFINVHVVDTYVWNDDVGEAGLEFVPWSKKLWVENKLERVREVQVSTVCSICMEEIVVGSAGTCMFSSFSWSLHSQVGGQKQVLSIVSIFHSYFDA